MTVDHSQTPVTLTINGQDVQFGRMRPKDLLDVIEWANARVQKQALELIPANSVTERLQVFRETRAFYTMDNFAELLEDPAALMELLYRCYRRSNEWTDRESFDSIFGAMDMPMLQQFLDALSGMEAEAEDPTQAAAGSEKKNMDSAKPSPPSANDTKD